LTNGLKGLFVLLYLIVIMVKTSLEQLPQVESYNIV